MSFTVVKLNVKKKGRDFSVHQGALEDVQQEVLIDGKVIVPCLRVYLGAKGLAGPRSFFYWKTSMPTAWIKRFFLSYKISFRRHSRPVSAVNEENWRPITSPQGSSMWGAHQNTDRKHPNPVLQQIPGLLLRETLLQWLTDCWKHWLQSCLLLFVLGLLGKPSCLWVSLPSQGSEGRVCSIIKIPQGFGFASSRSHLKIPAYQLLLHRYHPVEKRGKYLSI